MDEPPPLLLLLLQGHVTVVQNHRSAHVVLYGQFDLAETEHVDRVFQALAADPPGTVVLNLGGVEFMCSPTLSVLIALRDVCTAAGGAFVTSDCSPFAARVIQIAGLSKYLGLDVSHPAGRDTAPTSGQEPTHARRM